MIRIILILLLVAIAVLLTKIVFQLKANDKAMNRKPFEEEIDSYGIRNSNL